MVMIVAIIIAFIIPGIQERRITKLEKKIQDIEKDILKMKDHIERDRQEKET